MRNVNLLVLFVTLKRYLPAKKFFSQDTLDIGIDKCNIFKAPDSVFALDLAV